jgi:hypothetical protein
LLIDRFVEHREATAEGEEERVRATDGRNHGTYPPACASCGAEKDRAEQAREVAEQLTDPGASRAVLQVADTFQLAITRRYLARATRGLRPGRRDSWRPKSMIFSVKRRRSRSGQHWDRLSCQSDA